MHVVSGYDAARYGEDCAEFYDEIYSPPSRQALDLLVRLARGGPVLEAGVGTGRYALALAARGVPVHGVDASPAMLAVLRRKPGASQIVLSIGDFATLKLERRFRLVTCLVDTLTLLPRERQALALARLAAALSDDGLLLLETSPLRRDEAMHEPVEIELDLSTGPRRYRVQQHATELDLLDAWAAEAGLALQRRWGDWNGATWREGARLALSLYGRNSR